MAKSDSAPFKPRKSRRARIPAYAAARAKGLSQRAAAEAAGYAPGATAAGEARVLEKLPETQDLIARLREKYDLGADRVFRELDRGLKESIPEGNHGDYLDRAMKVNGIAQDKGGDGGGVNALIVGLVSALDSGRAREALAKAIPAEVVPQPQSSTPETPAA